jgi:hypothetical protein
MNIFKIIIDWKTYVTTAVAIVSFSHFIVQLFGQTIPNVVLTFFKDIGIAIIFAAVFVFAATWLINAKPHNRPKKYSLVIFDVYGNESKIEGLRTEFKTHDVAWSFMKQYKKNYPLNNFALVADAPKSEKKTIFRYI